MANNTDRIKDLEKRLAKLAKIVGELVTKVSSIDSELVKVDTRQQDVIKQSANTEKSTGKIGQLVDANTNRINSLEQDIRDLGDFATDVAASSGTVKVKGTKRPRRKADRLAAIDKAFAAKEEKKKHDRQDAATKK